MAIFLDDGLGGGVSILKAKINSLIVHADLTRYGFLINEDKSLWEPVQNITWLGTVFDTDRGFISVTESRISKLKSSIKLIRKIDCKIVKVKDLASVVGQVISLTHCVGGVARIMTRSMYAVVNQKLSWNSEVKLTDEACDELAFWDENVDSLNFHSPWAPLQPPAKFVYSDASDHACSSFIDNDHKIFHQNWSPAESSKSLTWRELRTVDLALSAFALVLQGKRVAWFTDNTSVVSIVHNGSKVTELQSLALSIFNLCARHGISLELNKVDS